MCSPLHYSYLSTGHEPPAAEPPADNDEPGACGQGPGPPPTGQAPDQLRRLATDGRTAPAGSRV